jgi:hypothetical protein
MHRKLPNCQIFNASLDMTHFIVMFRLVRRSVGLALNRVALQRIAILRKIAIINAIWSLRERIHIIGFICERTFAPMEIREVSIVLTRSFLRVNNRPERQSPGGR